MSGRKWVDKKKDRTYALVHRSHEDPLYYDGDASERVFVPVNKHKDNKKGSKNIRLETTKDLAVELENEKIRENEGEAALYGITYDDSSYDYMQHLRPIGNNDGIFIAKQEAQDEGKNRSRHKDIVLKSNAEELIPQEALPSKENMKIDYQNMQNIPDMISGFKPDMDPRLREVLTALDDEAYLDEEHDTDDNDIFADLLKEGPAQEGEEDVQDFDEWDMDNYEDEYKDYDSDNENNKGAAENWQDDFKKFKRDQKRGKIVNDWDSDDDFGSDDDDNEEEEEDVLAQLPEIKNAASKKKSKAKERRKKGALTDTSSFSMSSSALFRTEGLRIIDDKYELMAKKQALDNDSEHSEQDEEYQPFDMAAERADFEVMLDDFLENYELEGNGRRLVKKNNEIQRIKDAADSVSKSKLAARRKKIKEENVDKLTSGINSLKF
ncbi:hypothetical protein PACTADRAFT_47793 [Pachysolen tannophilus NRRL Y-2460]|uniref:Low temperature viability protein n=1 Tax=Pachysolen tannophilus NRRL Y-2460 TaxID=669874 RepID=A0A1E4U1S9_PACTA|nr:hypothetical protein PACTADRAFT_47793 [Pachysolen tannophilus NRRL Y-2460]